MKLKAVCEKMTCKRRVLTALFVWFGVSVLVLGYLGQTSNYYSFFNMIFVNVGTPRKASSFLTPPPGYKYEPTTEDDGCQGFNNNPFHLSIAKFFKTSRTLNCKGNLPNLLFFVKDKSVLKLKVDRDKAEALKVVVDYCKYASLHRKPGDDLRSRQSAWSKAFSHSITIDDDGVEYVLGDCFHGKKLVAHGYLTILRVNATNEAAYRKSYDAHVATNRPEETLSVLLFGVDGTSKQNLVRQMPKTKRFLLEKMGGIPLHKLNKVGLNTLPNVVPLLSGLSVEALRKIHSYNKDPFDAVDHIFLWKEARDKGYRTAMTLDRKDITSFHFLKKGWAYPKFDWYNRPLVLKSENDKVARKRNSYCIGDQTEMRVLYDQWLQMTAAFNNSKTTPYFAYSFFAHVSHDFINYLSMADEHYYRLFEKFRAQNSLNNTLLVFFSDHGSRMGEYRTTLRGMQEDNNPFMIFVFPPWFVRKYDELFANFRKNQHRLVTNYDIHATLKDILSFHPSAILRRGTAVPATTAATTATTTNATDTAGQQSTTTSSSGGGISLFNELPVKRTCEQAQIPLKFCNCRTVTSMRVASEIAVKTSQALLKQVVGKTNAFRKVCAALTLNATTSVLSIDTSSKTQAFFQVTIRTSPGGGLYEATVSATKATLAKIEVVGDVARVNMYRGQADCVSDSLVRAFCYCKNDNIIKNNTDIKNEKEKSSTTQSNN